MQMYAQENICGIYKSNVAQIGFFVEELVLKNDSTFNYYKGGDMFHQYGKGTFRINNGRLTIQFTKDDYGDLDSLISVGKITSWALDSISNHLLKQKEPDINQLDFLDNLEIVDWSDIKVDSMVFAIKNQKLFIVNENGKISRKAQAISKRKRYFFWGSTYMKKRKYFLLKQ